MPEMLGLDLKKCQDFCPTFLPILSDSFPILYFSIDASFSFFWLLREILKEKHLSAFKSICIQPIQPIQPPGAGSKYVLLFIILFPV